MTMMMELQCTLLLLSALVGYSAAQFQTCPTYPRCFGCSPGSTTIFCTGAGLTEFPLLPEDSQISVETLNLNGNSITMLRATDLQNFTSLETLNLQNNQLQSIEPGSFSTTTSLETLNLQDNRLTEIPDNLFQATSSLRNLDLSRNNIQNISAATFNGLSTFPFPTINLDNNVIRSIPNGTFSDLGIINSLTLTNNPFRCDCDLRWFPNFVTTTQILDSMYGLCDVPAGLNGRSLDSLMEAELVCDCTPDCVNGTCDMRVGECDCDDGFIGQDCSIPCSSGTFGAGCLQNCTCVTEQESSPCDHVNGTCHCIPGYTGESCEEECPEGYYGQDCLEECQCQNGASCDFITGFCNCTIGYMGHFCDMICPPLFYGLGCSETCVCETGNCHHITGVCSCPVGFFGANCSHNCTEVEDCADIGREECSLDTPEQTCGACLQGHVGEEGDGNEECILCSGAPVCAALNRHPCRNVPNTCGPCFQRHLGEEGYSNQTCFDPCIDGVMNYNETDIDCGGSLCPSCDVGNVCSVNEDCSGNGVCLGVYVHPTKLDFPFSIRDNNSCVDNTFPGNAILQRFKDALLGREDPLPNIDPLLDLNTFQEEVEDELQLQFDIREELENIEITDLDQAPGDPLYQTNIELNERRSGESFDQMVENMNNGKLRGTLLLNRRGKKALFNF